MRTSQVAPPERIITSTGVLLRPRAEEHALGLRDAIWQSGDHLRDWEGWSVDPKNATVEFQYERLQSTTWAWERGTLHVWLILSLDETAICGGIHLENMFDGTVETGYWLRHDRTGRGLVTTAVAALLPVAARMQHARTLQIQADEANVASNRVPERLGFALAGRTERPRQTAKDTGRVLVWQHPLHP